MREIDQMLREYVYPAIIISVIVGFVVIVANLGEAIDKEIIFQDNVYSQQGE